MTFGPCHRQGAEVAASVIVLCLARPGVRVSSVTAIPHPSSEIPAIDREVVECNAAAGIASEVSVRHGGVIGGIAAAGRCQVSVGVRTLGRMYGCGV